MGYIYEIKNIVNGKKYVGQTIQTIDERLCQHRSSARREDTPLHRAILKYGKENFIICMLEEIADNLLDERERYYIRHLNTLIPNGYNTTLRGTGVLSHSDKTKLKISNSLKGRGPMSLERRLKISEGLKGIKRSPETRAKLSIKATQRIGELNPFYGRHHTEETKKKIAEKAYGRPSSRRKSIICYLDGYERVFVSMTEAYNWLKENQLTTGVRTSVLSNLNRCIINNGFAYGYHWKFN